MDGYAVTQAIREREKAAGEKAHIPIVALTAHAMKGDRERCLAAGMDAYASKPIRAAELFAIIEQLLPVGGASEAESTADGEVTQGAVFDMATALGAVDGDRALLGQMARWFIDQSPKALRELDDSASRGDTAALARAAHKIKSSVGSLGARRSYEVAVRLEELGRAGDVSACRKTYPELAEAVGDLREALAALAAIDASAGDEVGLR
jgi:CheY-like chemotaxis protein